MFGKDSLRSLLGEVVVKRPVLSPVVGAMFAHVRNCKAQFLGVIATDDIEKQDIDSAIRSKTEQALDKLNNSECRFVLKGMVVKALTAEAYSYLMNKKRDEAKLGDPLQHPVSIYNPSDRSSTITILKRLSKYDLRVLRARDRRRARNTVVHSRDLWSRVTAAINSGKKNKGANLDLNE